ncbi:MAG TPA: serine protease [Bacteroidota bacterium]|nr:serine protease [Bacteroidota bacterium]
MKFTRLVVSIAGIALCLASCSTPVYREVYPMLLDGKYDSEFPYRDCSKQLEEIASTVKMITCVAYYRSLEFSSERRVTRQELQSSFTSDLANRFVYFTRTSSGSAVIITYRDRHLALLTCAHIVEFPDTIFSYYIGADKKPTPYVHSFAVKQQQSNYVAGVEGAVDMEILANDNANDVALLGKIYQSDLPFGYSTFSYPVGYAKELQWGSFIYLLGYPSGHEIVTKGIVSNPNKEKNGSFYADAVFSGGFSGGIVLAVRDGVPNFELVGIVRLVPGRTVAYLTPEHNGEQLELDTQVPYSGDIYVERRTDIEYGVMQAVSSETIMEFLSAHRTELSAKGYDLSQFMTRRPQKNNE